MTDLLAKLPLSNLTLLLGTALMIVGVLSQVSTKWFSLTLEPAQRVLLGIIGLALTVIAFTHKDNTCTASTRCLPVVDLPLIEKGAPIALKDGDRELFLRANDIHRYSAPGDTRLPYTELEFDTNSSVLTRKENILPGQKFIFEIDGRRYRVSYERTGQLDKRAPAKDGQAPDVVLMGVERVK